MKSLLGKLGVILIGLAIFGCAEVWGADWKRFSSSENGISYYDEENLTYPSRKAGGTLLTKLNYSDSIIRINRALLS